MSFFMRRPGKGIKENLITLVVITCPAPLKAGTTCRYTDYFQFLNIEMVFFKVLQEFAAGTTIHGFTFLVSPKSSPRTKIIWAISLVVALSYASWEMRKSAISKYHHIFRAMKQKPTIIIKYICKN